MKDYAGMIVLFYVFVFFFQDEDEHLFDILHHGP